MVQCNDALKEMEYYNNQKGKRFIPYMPQHPSKILEIGCAAGQLGCELRQKGLVSELTGVELFPAAAEQAKKYFDLVYTGDIEKMSFDYLDYFDIIICGDVLEHLRDPWTMTKNIYLWLKKGGIFISTVPNIRNWTILSDLIIFGNWKYSEKGGILDNTHLRFFTKKTYFEMLTRSNFKIIHREFIIHGRKYNLINRALLRSCEEFIGEQIFVVAEKVKLV